MEVSAPKSEPSRTSIWMVYRQFPVTRLAQFGLIFVGLVVLLSGPIWLLLPIQANVHRTVGMAVWLETVMAVSALAALYFMGRYVERRTLRDFGLGGGIAAIRETLLGFLIGAGIMSSVFAMLIGFGWCRVGPTLAVLTDGEQAGFRWMIVAFFSGAVFEEIVFRGYLLQTLERRWGTTVALIATMIVFGCAHMGSEGARTIAEKLFCAGCLTIEAGLVLASAYLLTRRLWMPIGLHWAWNLFQGPIYGGIVSGYRFGPSLIATTIHGPGWATGGRWGPEAGFPAIVIGTLAGLFLLRLSVLRGGWKKKPAA